jgi:D-glycerate 3-kinase
MCLFHLYVLTPSCLQLGISAPQGCGKTTLVFELEKLSTAFGIRAAAVSIDDFYLSYASQKKVTEAYPDNPLLAGRGNAGTHDLQLGKDVLTKLRQLRCVLQNYLPICGLIARLSVKLQ